MIVFVDLPQDVADLEMAFVVRGEVGFAAGNGDPAVRALEADVCGGLGGGRVCFARFGVRGGSCRAGRAVVGMRAVGVLAHEGCTAPDLGRGGVGEGVEEVVGLEEDAEVGGVMLLMRVWLLPFCCGVRRDGGGCGVLGLDVGEALVGGVVDSSVV